MEKSVIDTRKTIWLDVYLAKNQWYRMLRGGNWYQHQYTNDALQLSSNFIGEFWATYPEINRYTKVLKSENYAK